MPFYIRLQRVINISTFFFSATVMFFIFRFILRYKVENISELRKYYQKLMSDPRPLLICANHLTYIDSIIIIWALGSPFWYLRNFSALSWNLSAAQYSKNLFFRFVCYLGKGLVIEREGSKSHLVKMISLVKALLNQGEVVTIFPEGQRSRTGRFEVESLTFGTGRILAEVGDCRVLCIYLRGHRQKHYSRFPAFGSNFYFESREIIPRTQRGGRDGARELVNQIGKEITDLEIHYFAEHQKKSGNPW